MPLIVIKKNNPRGQVGDGGSVGVEKYLELVLGPPHFAPYILPQNILIKTVAARSTVNQNCTITATRTSNNTSFDLIGLTPYIADQKESTTLFQLSSEELSIDSFDADPIEYLYVTIIYQDFNI